MRPARRRHVTTTEEALAIALAVVVVAVAVYALVILPRKRRRPLLAAIKLVTSGDDALEEAERLLVDALTRGLRKRDLADARFVMSYVRARLGKHQEAATTIAELRASGADDAQTRYLQLWIESKNDRHNQVCAIYEEDDGLADIGQARLIASIAYLRRAHTHWRLREIEEALSCIDAVRALGELANRVPAHRDDLQIVFGIQAALDGRVEDAGRAFADARKRMTAAGRPATQAELALIVCDWRTTALPDVDDELGRIVDELVAAPPENTEAKTRAARDRLCAHAALLHAISFLYVLTGLPAKGGLPHDRHEELRERIRRVLKHDDELGDAILVGSLIDYYFATTDGARREAVAELERGTQTSRAIQLPEVLDLIARERELERVERDALNRFLALVTAYLEDDGVPEGLRATLRERLQQLSAYREIGAINIAAESRAAAPSIEDVRYRGALLRRRIGAIVHPKMRRGDEGTEELGGRLDKLDTITKTLAEDVELLEKAEHDVMVRTSEFLLPEDEEPRGESDAA